ncbi:MAG TPA: tetratricopeptide repeat protein [Blastocatellia bacterium]|jgi:tetratricopeptide (TPR) repeat protein
MQQTRQRINLWLRRKTYERSLTGKLIRAWQNSALVRVGLVAAPVIVILAITIAAIALGRGEHEELRRALEAWDAGDYEAAAEEYEEFLRSEPSGAQSLDARFQLANIYYLNLSRYDQAIAHYKEFLSQDASHPMALLARERMAEVLAETGRSYEAVAEFENLNPQDHAERRRIRLRIADLYFDQRNYSQALTEYEKVTAGEYDEMSERAYLREAAIYHIAREQYQQALPIYQRLASQTADAETRRRAVYGMADCYASLFRFDEAIETLRQIADASEQSYVAKRIAELEQKRQEAALARSKVQAKE